MLEKELSYRAIYPNIDMANAVAERLKRAGLDVEATYADMTRGEVRLRIDTAMPTKGQLDLFIHIAEATDAELILSLIHI